MSLPKLTVFTVLAQMLSVLYVSQMLSGSLLGIRTACLPLGFLPWTGISWGQALLQNNLLNKCQINEISKTNVRSQIWDHYCPLVFSITIQKAGISSTHFTLVNSDFTLVFKYTDHTPGHKLERVLLLFFPKKEREHRTHRKIGDLSSSGWISKSAQNQCSVW